MSMHHRSAAVALAVVVGAAGGGAVARADVACAVVEIEASTAAAPSVDPDLKALEKKLKKPPFTSWNAFRRLGVTNLVLAPQQVGVATLVHGKAGLMLRDVVERPGKKLRVSLGITLDDDGGKRVIDTKVSVDAGDYFVVGRPLTAAKGQLVALSCKP